MKACNQAFSCQHARSSEQSAYLSD
jgi:hypothetical protein